MERQSYGQQPGSSPGQFAQQQQQYSDPTYDYGIYRKENSTPTTPHQPHTVPTETSPWQPPQSSFPASSASSMTISMMDDEKNDPEHDGAKAHSHGHDGVDIYDPNRPKLPLKQRMHHFTWAWFTLIMSTGGLSLLFFAQPHQIPVFKQIGFGVYIVNMILFICVVAALVTRFILNPGDLKGSLTHPREGFFVPTFFLSCATAITSTHRYAIPVSDYPLGDAIQTAFWGYVIVTLFLAVFQYSYVFASHSFALQTMMPTWILPIFPIMLSGTIASVIADTQPDIAAVPIVIAGLACQGLGMFVSLIMYSHMVGRLMQAGLPNREHRPGLFMNVGPPSFTALALIGMANGLPDTFDAGTGMAGILDAAMLRTMAVVGAVFLWGLGLWWFGVAVISVLLSRPKYFHLGWWAMVFPNTGFTLATISLANAFKNEPALYVANAMSLVLLLVYCLVLFFHIRAVLIQDIMYPGRDEDVEDH